MRKIISIIVLFALVLCLGCLTACGGKKPSQGQQGQQQGSNTVSFSFADTSGLGENDIMNTVAEKLGKYVTIPEDGAEPEGMLITFGEQDYEVSRLAYRKMERSYSYNENSSIWLIYSTGTEVAIAYSDLLAREAAVEYFLENCLDGAIYEVGYTAYEEFNSLEYVTASRDAYREEQFASFEAELGSGAAEAMKLIYSLYDENTYIWLANLWDPVNGGFYYSASARDTEGYLPDIESTRQALTFIENTGMLVKYNYKYANALPEEMKDALLDFARGLQSPEDGYFYHPQWGTNITTSRRGRDLGSATGIIRALGAIPYYDAPNGTKGENRITPAGYLQSPLSSSTVIAVSKVVPTASGLPSYLTDVERWKEYLDELWSSGDSYSAGNTLDAISGQVSNAGEQFKNYLHTFLDSHQYESTGLWEDEVSYNAVNGLMKICGVYSSFGWTIPKAEKALEGAMEIALRPDGAAHICSVYNPWVAMSDLIDSIAKTEGAERAEELRAAIRERASELITVTFNKMSMFKKDDGGFSYFKNYSSSTSQGAPAALPNTAESDMNATVIANNGIPRHIFSTLGADYVYSFCNADYSYFTLILTDLGAILKDEIPEAKKMTFDDYVGFEDEENVGLIENPSQYTECYVNDMETLEDGTYKWFNTSVVGNPAKSQTTSDLVLLGESFIYSGEEKTKADAASGITFHMSNFAASGDTYIFDGDIYVDSATNDSTVGQIFFGNSTGSMVSLNLKTYSEDGQQYLRIGENSDYPGNDGKTDESVAGAIKAGEWNHLRIEVYKLYEYIEGEGSNSSELSIKVKVYVNDEYQGECDGGYVSKTTGKFIDRKITFVKFSFYRHARMKMYFNNIYVSKSSDTYSPSVNPNEVTDAPLPDEEMRDITDFEDGMLQTSNVHNLKAYYEYGVSSFAIAGAGEQSYNTSVIYNIADDPSDAANKVLKVSVTKTGNYDSESNSYKYSSSRTEVLLSNPDAEGDVYIFSGRIRYDADITAWGDVTQCSLKNEDDKIIYGFRVNAYKGSTGPALKLIEYNNLEGGTGTGRVLCSEIPMTEWSDIRIEFYVNKNYSETTNEETGETETVNSSTLTTRIYINGEFACEDTSYRRNNFTKEVINFSLSHQRANKHTVYLDDLSLTRNDIEYKEIERVASFEGETLNSNYLKNYLLIDAEGTMVSADSLTAEEMTALSSAYTSMYLADDPTGAANRVLKIVKFRDAGKNVGYASTKVVPSNEDPKGNCITFESGFYMSSVQYDTTYIRFYDMNGDVLTGFRFYARNSNTFTLYQHNTASGGTGSGIVTDFDGNDVTVAGDGWITLRIELYRGGSAETTVSKIYIGVGDAEPTLVTEVNAYNYTNNTTRIFSHVGVVYHTERAGILYLDDVSVTQTDKAFVSEKPEIPPIPDGPTDGDENGSTEGGESGGTEGGGTEGDNTQGGETASPIMDFEGGNLDSTYVTNIIGMGNNGEKAVADFTEGEMTGYVGTYVTLSVISELDAGISESVNKVLAVNKVRQPTSGSSSNGTASYTSKTRVALSNNTQVGECYTFETDMYISNVAYDVTMFNIVDTNANVILGLRFYNNSESTFYIQEQNTNGGTGCTGNGQLKDSEGTAMTFATGKWYTLRIEWYRTGETTSTMAKIYLYERGTTPVCIVDQVMYKYQGLTRTVSYMEIQHRSARAGKTYFDNISFSRTDKAYVAEAVLQ